MDDAAYALRRTQCEVYHGTNHAVKGETPLEAKKARKPLNKKSISLAEARDGSMSKGAHRALVALLFLAGSRDALDVSDEALAALMSSDRRVVPPASVRGLLACLKTHGYITLARKRKGCDERHIVLCNPFEVRGKGQENPGQETPGKAPKRDSEICTEPAQISHPPENKNKETPTRALRPTRSGRVRESLPRESTRSGDQKSLNQESLNSDSSPRNSREVPRQGDHSLADLARWGAEHYPDDVVQAAVAFGDIPGLLRYSNIYRDLAKGNQDLWAEVVERTIEYQRGRGIDAPTPRAYLETTVKKIAQKRADEYDAGEVIRRRDAIVAADKTFRRVIFEAIPDDVLDGLIAVNPFADDLPDDLPEEPAPAPDPAPEPAPDPAAGPVIHPAVAEAVQSLGLQVAVEDVHVVFEGACRGREALFALVVSAMTGIAVQSPIAFMCRVADEHKGKDDAYLLDRASGMTAAERTARLKEFEAWLEDQKQALNPPLTPCGGFRSDTPQDLKALLGGIMDQASKTASAGVPPYLASVTLPSTPQGWAALEEGKGQMRDAYSVSAPRLRAEADAAGTALAHSKVARAENPREWDQWRRAGVYHAFQVLRQAEERAEAVRREQERQDVPEPQKTD